MAGEHTLTEPKLRVTPWCTPISPSQVSTFYPLQNQRNSPDKILKLMVTTTRSKVKSRSHHDVAHLQHLSNYHTNYPLPAHDGFTDVSLKIFQRSRSLQQDQRSNQGHTIMLHMHNPQPMFVRRINSLRLTVAEI